MPRVKSNSYDTKRSLIMDKAAQLFASSGYPNARMMDIAAACSASKSMLYHYFQKKEDILYCILEEHLDEIIGELKLLIEASDEHAEEPLIRTFVNLFVQKSAKSRTRHIVAMLDVKYLPRKQELLIKSKEVEIVELTRLMLKKTNPNLPAHEYSPYALLLIGTINSMDTWRRPNGRYSASEMSNMLSNLFLSGFLNAASSAK